MCKKLQGRLNAQWESVKERCRQAGEDIKYNTEGLHSRFEDTSLLARTKEGTLPSGSPQLKSPPSGRKRKRSDKEDASRKMHGDGSSADMTQDAPDVHTSQRHNPELAY